MGCYRLFCLFFVQHFWVSVELDLVDFIFFIFSRIATALDFLYFIFFLYNTIFIIIIINLILLFFLCLTHVYILIRIISYDEDAFDFM